MQFQTRNMDGEIKQFATFAEAKAHANVDMTVWKISFTIPATDERIRLIRGINGFVYENINGER